MVVQVEGREDGRTGVQVATRQVDSNGHTCTYDLELDQTFKFRNNSRGGLHLKFFGELTNLTRTCTLELVRK